MTLVATRNQQKLCAGREISRQAIENIVFSVLKMDINNLVRKSESCEERKSSPTKGNGQKWRNKLKEHTVFRHTPRHENSSYLCQCQWLYTSTVIIRCFHRTIALLHWFFCWSRISYNFVAFDAFKLHCIIQPHRRWKNYFFISRPRAATSTNFQNNPSEAWIFSGREIQ